MFEILMFLFESYFDSGSYPDNDKLSRKLTAAGFEDEEISDALTWLSALHSIDNAAYSSIVNHEGIRFFANTENQFLSDESRNFLIFAEHQRMISPTEREMIIDRALAIGLPSLAVDRVKLIMLIVLWNQRHDLDPMLVEELLSPLSSSQIH